MKLKLIIAGVVLLQAWVQAVPLRHPIYESGWENVADTGNVLLNAKVTASGYWAAMTPSLAVDGEFGNPEKHWACEKLPAVLTAELKEAKTISAVRMFMYWPGGRVYSYFIEGSSDGVHWKRVVDQSANSIAGTPEGSLFTFEPMRVKFVRATVVDSSRRSAGGHIVEMQAFEQAPASTLQGGIGAADIRYDAKGDYAFTAPDKGVDLTVWRGERVNAQVVVWAGVPLSQLSLTLTPFQNKRAVEKKLSSPFSGEASFVRYVLVNSKPTADIIDNQNPPVHPARVYRPIWVSFNVPRDAAPGCYEGMLKVQSEIGFVSFPIRLTVKKSILPSWKDWKFHLDLWQHPITYSRYHDLTPWSDEHLAVMKPSLQRLAQMGQKAITCAIVEEAWNAQTFDWFPSMVLWEKHVDGTWSYDYTIFDKWVTFMMKDVGITGQIDCYSMVPWHLKFRYYDEASSKFMDAQLKPGTEEYDAFWGRFLKDFVAHLKSKGWLEKTKIALDERPDALVMGAKATIAKHAPELGIVSAINRPSAVSEDFYSICPIIGHLNAITPDLIQKRRAKGLKTLFYVCCSPARPNTFTFSPLAESAWLPIAAARYELDGFLRWAYATWVEDPMQSTDFVSWPSGDTNFVYPNNRSSLRLEVFRDGIEAFEKYHVVKAELEKAGDSEGLGKLKIALDPFTWAEGQKNNGQHLEAVRNFMAVLESLSQ